MKTAKTIFVALISLFSSVMIVSCDKDDDNTIFNEPDTPAASNLSAPKADMYLTTTDYDGVSFRVRFTNGGDITENMSCKVHWRRYSTKQTKTPKASDMTNHESMRQYGGGTSTKTTFDKSHAGISGYLYYYFECSNSRYTTTTDVTYCVVKR